MDLIQETQKIEHLLGTDHSKGHSAFYSELHRIRELDSKNGILNIDRYRKDLATIEQQLQKDGYLPQFKLLLSGDESKAGNRAHAVEARTETDKLTSSRVESTGGKLYEMHKLPHRSGDHNNPDAMVLLPKNFDPSKPIHLVVYDHGWYDSAKSSYDHAHLAEQMAKAPPNTVLIVPEWQRTPGSSGKEGGNQGASSNENFMSGLVQDIFNRTPELKGKTLADVDHIGIISHSAGFHAAERQLYNNGEFSKKVDSVTLLDSLYDSTGFDKWIKDNIKDLSNGNKHFHNIFNTSTANNSRAQAVRVERMLKEAGLSTDSLSTDFENKGRPATSKQLHRHACVFKATSTSHMEIPQKYTAVVQAAANGDETV